MNEISFKKIGLAPIYEKPHSVRFPWPGTKARFYLCWGGVKWGGGTEYPRVPGWRGWRVLRAVRECLHLWREDPRGRRMGGRRPGCRGGRPPAAGGAVGPWDVVSHTDRRALPQPVKRLTSRKLPLTSKKARGRGKCIKHS